MRVCIIGAGAIGGFIGARLAAAGQAQVSALARGATLQALSQHGWRLRQGGALLQTPARASDDAAVLGVQDLVIIAVKGPALSAVAGSIAPLLGPRTRVMPAMNGVPWWFGQSVPAIGSEGLHSVDPDGSIGRAIDTRRVVGCVVHASTLSIEPGFVQHRMGQGLVVGEPGGGRSDAVQALADLLTHAGFELTHSADIRRDVWYKLWGNMTMNPVSAITGATADLILGDPLVRAFNSAAMREAAAIGALLGCPIEQSPEDRHAITARLGAFKTSMLQDVEAGKTIELESIVGAVRELGQRLGVSTPSIDALYGLTRLFGQVHGLLPAPAAGHKQP